MGRRKNAAVSPISSAGKPKKEKNRSSLMPFRRGDSSRSEPDTERASMSGRPLTPIISGGQGEPTESTMRPAETDQRPSVPTNVEAQQSIPLSAELANGIIGAENKANAAEISGQVDQTPSSNHVLPPGQVISSFELHIDCLLMWHSHYTNSVSPHHLLSIKWMPYLVLSKKRQQPMRKSRPPLTLRLLSLVKRE